MRWGRELSQARPSGPVKDLGLYSKNSEKLLNSLSREVTGIDLCLYICSSVIL